MIPHPKQRPTPAQIRELQKLMRTPQAQRRARAELPTAPTSPPAGDDPVQAAIAALEAGDFRAALTIVQTLADEAVESPTVHARRVTDLRNKMRRGRPELRHGVPTPLEQRVIRLEPRNAQLRQSEDRDARVKALCERNKIDPKKFAALRSQMRRTG